MNILNQVRQLLHFLEPKKPELMSLARPYAEPYWIALNQIEGLILPFPKHGQSIRVEINRRVLRIQTSLGIEENLWAENAPMKEWFARMDSVIEILENHKGGGDRHEI